VLRLRSKIVALSFLFFLALSSASVRAEETVRLFVGGAFTHDHDVTDKFNGIGNFVLKNPDFDNSVSFGGSVAHWFGGLPYLGLGLDVSHFRPNISKQSGVECDVGVCANETLESRHFRVTGITFNFLGRLPLIVSNPYPQGRIQPYVSVGPTAFISHVKMAGGHFVPDLPQLRNQEDTDVSLGVAAGAGVSFMITPHIDVFSEYRFTHFSPEYHINSGGERGKVTTDLNTHHVLVGLSYHFCTLGC
jgi:opacity protein-like surface antigen